MKKRLYHAEDVVEARSAGSQIYRKAEVLWYEGTNAQGKHQYMLEFGGDHGTRGVFDEDHVRLYAE